MRIPRFFPRIGEQSGPANTWSVLFFFSQTRNAWPHSSPPEKQFRNPFISQTHLTFSIFLSPWSPPSSKNQNLGFHPRARGERYLRFFTLGFSGSSHRGGRNCRRKVIPKDALGFVSLGPILESWVGSLSTLAFLRDASSYRLNNALPNFSRVPIPRNRSSLGNYIAEGGE